MKGIKIMRELNEQELNQVAGGSGFTFNHQSLQQAAGTAIAGSGLAYSDSVTGSTNGVHSSSAFAGNKGFAFGTTAGVESAASNFSSTTVTRS